MNYNFPVIHWCKKSTRVQFKPFTEMPNEESVTSCMVFVKKDNSVLLTRPERGWGLPGGHRESDESPEDCARREVREEADVEPKNLTLVGGWKAQKIIHIEENDRYPEIAYQLLFLADVEQINKFVPNHESLERKFVNYNEIKKYHHEFDRFSIILTYILDRIKIEHW